MPTLNMILRREPKPDGIVIETSGLSNPAEIVRTLLDPVIWKEAALETVICVADARALIDDPTLAEEALWQSQLAAADLVALSKPDLVSDAARDRARALVGRFKADHLIHGMIDGYLAPELLFANVANRSPPSGMTPDEARRGIHVGHDLVLHHPVHAGEELSVQAHVTAVSRRPAGATQELLFVATDASGAVVWRTRFASLFLGVELEGEPASTDVEWPATPTLASAHNLEPIAVRQSTVGVLDAHVYSECARIWNPIHTDVVAARAAGLPAPILHGTATLARAVSIVTDLAGVALGDVCRVAGLLGAMVALGSTIEVRVRGRVGTTRRVWGAVFYRRGGRRFEQGGSAVRIEVSVCD